MYIYSQLIIFQANTFFKMDLDNHNVIDHVVYIDGKEITCLEGSMLVVVCDTDACMTVIIDHPELHVEGEVALPVGGHYICFCALPNDSRIDITLGPRNYQIKNRTLDSMLIVMPLNPETDKGGVATLKSLTYADLLAQNIGNYYLKQTILPQALVDDRLKIRKFNLIYSDELGWVGSTCTICQWHGFADPQHSFLGIQLHTYLDLIEH
jgi:hypothetical protein